MSVREASKGFALVDDTYHFTPLFFPLCRAQINLYFS